MKYNLFTAFIGNSYLANEPFAQDIDTDAFVRTHRTDMKIQLPDGSCGSFTLYKNGLHYRLPLQLPSLTPGLAKSLRSHFGDKTLILTNSVGIQAKEAVVPLKEIRETGFISQTEFFCELLVHWIGSKDAHGMCF